MNKRAAQLMCRLEDRHGHTITEGTARKDISTQVALVAERLRIGRQAAKHYAADDYIAGFADHIAAVTDRLDRHDDRATAVGRDVVDEFPVCGKDFADVGPTLQVDDGAGAWRCQCLA
jgi:hypothetical protein